jgi:aspartyl-tRNA(Asn)/glutamyl-tRNA(Gln) amidotransferase subunit A
MPPLLTDQIVGAGVAGLAPLFRSGAVDPVDVLARYLARVERLNPELNALIYLDVEGARLSAQASAQRWRDGAPRSPLDGVPIAIKANIALAGAPWHAGVAAYRDRIAEADAVCVARLRAAGAVILGLTNMHEAAFGATNENAAFGRCHNPHRPGFTPGGSSGGSASAVAAGLCAAALGTDTLGSVRIPAAYCGVFGLKLKLGDVYLSGVQPLSPSLDCLGVLARSVDDIALMTRALTGAACGWEHVPSQTLRCGVVDLAGQLALSPDMAAAFNHLLDRARGDGLAVQQEATPALDGLGLRRLSLLVVAKEALAEYGAMIESKPNGFSPDFHRIMAWVARQPADRLAAAQHDLQSLRLGLQSAFGAFDAILTPTTPTPAFAFDTDQPVGASDLTQIANLADMYAIAFPIGLSRDGLPLSAQVLSNDQALALRLAGRLARPV